MEGRAGSEAGQEMPIPSEGKTRSCPPESASIATPLRPCKLLILHQNRLHLLQMLRQHFLVRHNRGVVRWLALEHDVVDELLAQLSDAAGCFVHLPDLSVLNQRPGDFVLWLHGRFDKG